MLSDGLIIVGMKDKFPITKTLNIVSAVLFLLSLGSLFLPILKVSTATNESIRFFGWTVLFGGTVEATTESGIYSFSFGVNIGLLITMQGLLLSAAACFLCGRSKVNRVFAAVLSLASLVALFFTRNFVAMSSAVAPTGLAFAFGWWMAVGFAGIGIYAEGMSIFSLSVKERR